MREMLSTSLGDLRVLEFGWWDVAEAFVQAGVVEPADPLDERELELGSWLPDAVGRWLPRRPIGRDVTYNRGVRPAVGHAGREGRLAVPVSCAAWKTTKCTGTVTLSAKCTSALRYHGRTARVGAGSFAFKVGRSGYGVAAGVSRR
jgi:hypothetical protein